MLSLSCISYNHGGKIGHFPNMATHIQHIGPTRTEVGVALLALQTLTKYIQ